MSKDNKDMKSNINDLLFSQPAKQPTAEAKRYKNVKNPSKAIAIRLRQDDIDKLNQHFKLKGLLNTSTGIRQIIAKYMQDNNLL